LGVSSEASEGTETRELKVRKICTATRLNRHEHFHAKIVTRAHYKTHYLKVAGILTSNLLIRNVTLGNAVQFCQGQFSVAFIVAFLRLFCLKEWVWHLNVVYGRLIYIMERCWGAEMQ